MEQQIKRDPVTGVYYYEEVRDVEDEIEVIGETPQEPTEPIKRGRPKKR